MALRPMLARGGELRSGDGWAFELKFDGFRAVVSTEGGPRVRSRRGWEMTERLPELAELPDDLVLDGDVVAFNEKGVPQFPAICARVLHGDDSIAVTFAARDGSRWRIVAIGAVPPRLAEEGFEATWVVDPLD